MANENDGDHNEQELWHGTRKTEPEALYKKKKVAFDMRYCDRGLWGQGAYFAEDARYSKTYI